MSIQTNALSRSKYRFHSKLFEFLSNIVTMDVQECSTVSEEKCETEYMTKYEEECTTVTSQQCSTVNEQQCTTVTEQESRVAFTKIRISPA